MGRNTGRLVAVGVAALLLPLGTGSPVAADQLGKLPVAATEITGADANLRDASREVVAVLRSGGRARVRKFRTASTTTAAQLVTYLNTRPGVVASRNATVRASSLDTEPMGSKQYDMTMIGAPTAWASSLGNGVVVAVLDTGVDSKVADLAGRVLPELDMLPDVAPSPDSNGHGTFVASIIAAAHDGTGIAGVAPGATILPVAALDEMGYGDVETVARGIIAAADAGAKVINMSLGGPDRDKVLDSACDYAHARGVVLVAAAGNSRKEGNRVQYPAASPNVIAVGSVDQSGNVSYFSNTGKYIDIAAPGEGIYGTTPRGKSESMDGTSAAAPHVSGAIALAAAVNPGLSADDLVSAVVGSAVNPAGAIRTNTLGAGVLRADLALNRAQALDAPAAEVTGVRRIDSFDASPEPVKRHENAALIAKVSALGLDGAWRTAPADTYQVRFEFNPAGKGGYRTLTTTSVLLGGYAATQFVAPKSGRWRAVIDLTDGTKAVSKSDYLKVRR
ncbi:MAG: S8 family serine peptidase [Candidatus Nanopelagicales bacterium]